MENRDQVPRGSSQAVESSAPPFVSVVTPVFNGEPFLAECIESVLAQDYPFSEYIIVNNCRTDGPLQLAKDYASRDPRIRVTTNEAFVNCEENHNNAFRQISSCSRYCKTVAADDRLLPQCLGKMVRCAEQHPKVGVVGSYQQNGARVLWMGLPTNVAVVAGRDVCRMELLHGLHVMGNPTSVLYRSDLLQRTGSFFPHSEPHADTSAFFAALKDCDFGFVHEVLSVERVHEGQGSSRVRRLGADYSAALDLLLHYGPLYLSEAELAARQREVLAIYYRMLGCGMLKWKRREFWDFHRLQLKRAGYALSWGRVLMEAARELIEELRSPKTAVRKFKTALSERRQWQPTH
jgi:glycosyltransferase involved in cell wall biosynthesis